jgi:hypothetical protein
LRPGKYKAITYTFNSDFTFVINQNVTIFEIPNPEVEMMVHLTNAQVSPGDPIEATILLTNTNSISATGNLMLVSQSIVTPSINAWYINLAPSETQRLTHTFETDTEGSYDITYSVTDGNEEISIYNVAYVVGMGPALAFNVVAQDIYSPSHPIEVFANVQNAGNVSTTTSFSLVTLDILREVAYHNTIFMNVNEGEQISIPVTALTDTLAIPGLYKTEFFLGGEYRGSVHFSVKAENTLYAHINSGQIHYCAGETVPLTVTVMDNSFTSVDPTSITLTTKNPMGIKNNVLLTRAITGTYVGTFTSPVSGTFSVNALVTKANHRTVSDDWFFVIGKPSIIRPMVISGRPVLNQSNMIVMTLNNEYGVPVVDARVTVSGTMEYLSMETDETGKVALNLSPVDLKSYEITLERAGFASTFMSMEVFWSVKSVVYLPTILRSE